MEPAVFIPFPDIAGEEEISFQDCRGIFRMLVVTFHHAARRRDEDLPVGGQGYCIFRTDFQRKGVEGGTARHADRDAGTCLRQPVTETDLYALLYRAV